MKPIDTTAASQTDTLSLEVELKHAPAKVWRALTTPELLTEWLLPVTGFELLPGVAFTFQTEPHPGWDGAVQCEMLDVEPLQRLSYRWRVGGMELDTVVTFSLTQVEAGTLLKIEQSGFKPHQKQNFGGARYGWKSMGGRLVDLLERTE